MPQGRSRTRLPKERVRSFQEVHLGLSAREAITDARIFLEREGVLKGDPCPLGTDHVAVLRLVAKGDFASAFDKLLETNPLPEITGRLAPDPYGALQVYNQNGDRISLRRIERFLADRARSAIPGLSKTTGRPKVAVVGGGVAGLSLSHFLSRRGQAVTLFESADRCGGSLVSSCGLFRVPQRTVDGIIARTVSRGIEIVTSTIIGRSLGLRELLDRGFSSCILSVGDGAFAPLGIPGEGLAGVFDADQIMRVSREVASGARDLLLPLGPRVLVVGHGEAALDAARTALRFGREVTVLVGGREGLMDPVAADLREAVEEGVRIKTMARPVRIEDNGVGCVKGLVCQMLRPSRQGEGLEDEPQGEFLIEAETIVNAGEASADTLFLRDTGGLDLGEGGVVRVVSPEGETTLEHVWACGGCVTPGMTLLETLAAAARTAQAVV